MRVQIPLLAGKGLTMTVDEAKERVERIRALSGDSEAAHSAEDDLLRDFVVSVAAGEAPVSAVAKEILKTYDIKFSRYCS